MSEVEEGPVAEDQDSQQQESGGALEGDAEPIEGEVPTDAVEDSQDQPEELDPEEAAARALETLKAEAADNYDKFLRAKAELDNYRKRTAKIRVEVREETLRDLLLGLAPIFDNLRRALGQDTDDVAVLKEGIELICGQIEDGLKGYGLEVIDAVGKPFDPNVHEAMMEMESEDHEPGTVVEELDRGYLFGGRVVRPARVVVSKAGGTNG